VMRGRFSYCMLNISWTRIKRQGFFMMVAFNTESRRHSSLILYVGSRYLHTCDIMGFRLAELDAENGKVQHGYWKSLNWGSYVNMGLQSVMEGNRHIVIQVVKVLPSLTTHCCSHCPMYQDLMRHCDDNMNLFG
jgi:hypothetical protein